MYYLLIYSWLGSDCLIEIMREGINIKMSYQKEIFVLSWQNDAQIGNCCENKTRL